MKKYQSQYEKMTQQPVESLVAALAIPTTLSMLVTNMYNMVDTMFVGKLGTSASGAVGIVFGFMAMVQAFGFMFGQGAGSIIARRLGNRDTKTAGKVASTSFFFTLVIGIVIMLIGLHYIKPLVYLLGSTDTIFPYAKTYITYILIAVPFMLCTFVMNNILRFEGKASLAMIGVISGAILNMIGDPIFMFAMHMGIAGAGLSTALSQCISFVLLLFMFLSGKTQSNLSIHNITWKVKDILDIGETGLPSLLRQGLQSVSTVILNSIAASYGDAPVAAMSIVSRISMFIFSVALGIGQGFQPVCGYNYGAKKYSRVRKAFRFTLIISTILIGIFAVVGLLFSSKAIGVFRDDSEVIQFGIPALHYQCIAMFLQPVIVLSNMTFQSVGRKKTASVLSMLRSGIYFIPLILIFSTIFGKLGIQIAQPMSDILSFITALPIIIFFLRRLPQDKEL